MPLPPPTPAVLASLNLIPHLLRPLKRTRPRIPFWQIPAHRLPTRWSLYRPLLALAPSLDVGLWIRYKWRVQKGETSPIKVREMLLGWEKMLRVFERAADGGEREQRVVERYRRLIRARKKRLEWVEIEDEELKRMQALYNRPKLTGAIVRGSPAHKPFPRLKPQPPNISHIIRARYKARERRAAAQSLYQMWVGFVKDEIKEEEMLGLGKGRRMFRHAENEWLDPIREHIHNIDRMFNLDTARQTASLTPEQVAKVREARRRRIKNMTYHRQRELRGEVTPRSYLRTLQGPPGRILAQMRAMGDEKWRLRDRTVRGPGWGGWAGKTKVRRGMRMRKRWSEARWRREKRERGLPYHDTGELQDMI